jgi:DNA replication protein DnaC
MTTIDVATLAEAQTHEQRLREQAGELRLHGLLGRWAEVMGNPEQSRWVAQLLGWEAAERHRRSLERRLRDARIGAFKSLAEFDWKWPTHCDRAVVEELMTLAFLEDSARKRQRHPCRSVPLRSVRRWRSRCSVHRRTARL